ncbi:TIR domain-containing protein [Syntrophus buswellii]|jgi:hypothetical protein|uniref:TIR domain-containing protein n=1 Tax=Syntrophus buswellii TaxID=43774 RepID=UPI0038D36A1C
MEPIFDAFICHASEDKEDVVRPLARMLAGTGLNIWYDEFSLKLGDSLRQSIEKGLANSRYGIVVISHHFFEKGWPQAELNGLFAREMMGEKIIVPIWFNIEYADIVKISPIIADKYAAKISDGLDRVVEQLLDVLEPTLLHVSKNNLITSIAPNNFRLQGGDWSVKTSVFVSNRSESTLYALSIKLTIQSDNYSAKDVHVDIVGDQGTDVKASPGLPPVSGDSIIFDGIDSERHEALLVILSKIAPKQNREIIFSGRRTLKKTEEALASVKICDFNTEPVEFFMECQGKVAFKFQVPETFTMKSIRWKKA